MSQILRVAAAVVGIVVGFGPAVGWAESGSRTGDPANFLDQSKCPPPNGTSPCFDAGANGERLAASLAVTYDKLPVPTAQDCAPTAQNPDPLHDQCKCRPVAFVKNMYVNLTVTRKKALLPFTAEYLNGPPSHTTTQDGFTQPGFCLLTQTPAQVEVMTTMVKNRVIPFFYNCTPDMCPEFRVKAITDFQYTTADERAIPNPFAGGFSAEITIAVQQ